MKDALLAQGDYNVILVEWKDGAATLLDPAEPYFQYTDKVVRLDPTDALFVDVIHTDVPSFYSVDIGYHYKVTLAIASGKGREERGNLFVKLTGSAAIVGEVEITEESTYINPGSSHSFMVTSPQELGTIQKVALRFEHDATFFDWGTWGWFHTPAIYLDSIDVYSGEAQTSVSGGLFLDGKRQPETETPISFTPDSPSDIATTYTVCTRQDSSGTTINATNFGSIGNTTFNGTRPTKFVVHGFAEFHNQKYQDMKDALLAQGDYNVILVEWKDGAAQLYGQATANTRIVGAQIAQLIEYLKNTTNAKPGDMHIIGHILGSHVAGYAGERTPAEPYFQYTDKVVRLDPTDALFVDVIHTDVSSFYSVEIGFGMVTWTTIRTAVTNSQAAQAAD
nr:hypothetical protein BaRGS_032611 [Batillaria attramentaria]